MKVQNVSETAITLKGGKNTVKLPPLSIKEISDDFLTNTGFLAWEKSGRLVRVSNTTKVDVPKLASKSNIKAVATPDGAVTIQPNEENPEIPEVPYTPPPEAPEKPRNLAKIKKEQSAAMVELNKEEDEKVVPVVEKGNPAKAKAINGSETGSLAPVITVEALKEITQETEEKPAEVTTDNVVLKTLGTFKNWKAATEWISTSVNDPEALKVIKANSKGKVAEAAEAKLNSLVQE